MEQMSVELDDPVGWGRSRETNSSGSRAKSHPSE